MKAYGKLHVEDNHALEQMGEHVAAGGAMIARGVSRGVLNCVQNCAALASKLVTNPSQAACDLVYYRFYVPIALSNILLRAVTDRDGLWKDGTQLYESVRSYLKNTPGMQMAEDGITFLTEAIIFGMLRSKGKQCFGVLKEKAKNIKVVVALQHKVAEQVSKGKEVVANAVAPMKKVLEDTKERLSNVISKEPDVATKNTALKTAAAVKKLTFTDKEIEALLAANKKWTVKALFHIFKGECIEGKLVSGLHTKKALKHLMKKLRKYGIKPSDFKMETLPNGVTRIVLPFEAFVNRKCRGRAIARLFDGTKIERAKNSLARSLYTSKTHGGHSFYY